MYMYIIDLSDVLSTVDSKVFFTGTTCFNYGRCFAWETDTTGYLKNHWTKHRFICTHFEYFLLIPNDMVTTFDSVQISVGQKLRGSWKEFTINKSLLVRANCNHCFSIGLWRMLNYKMNHSFCNYVGQY